MGWARAIFVFALAFGYFWPSTVVTIETVTAFLSLLEPQTSLKGPVYAMTCTVCHGVRTPLMACVRTVLLTALARRF
jgi:hypothetical protein